MRNLKARLEQDIAQAHKYSVNNRADILLSETCGCFYCVEIFAPKEIDEWCDNDNTAICPRCGIDSVIGSQFGFLVTKAFLQKIRNHWFSENTDQFIEDAINYVGAVWRTHYPDATHAPLTLLYDQSDQRSAMLSGLSHIAHGYAGDLILENPDQRILTNAFSLGEIPPLDCLILKCVDDHGQDIDLFLKKLKPNGIAIVFDHVLDLFSWQELPVPHDLEGLQRLAATYIKPIG